MPQISIIMPTYNCGKYIAEAIDSVLNQTFSDFEIIVIDDGSTDNTKELLSSYIANGQIRYFYQENNGPASARNRGLKEATGEYVSFLDCDDCFLPEFLDKNLSYAKQSDYDVVICQRYYQKIEESNGQSRLVLIERQILPSSPQELYRKLFHNFVGCLKMVAKKTCFNKVGLFDENLFSTDDFDIWLRFAENNLRIGMVSDPAPLFVYRIRNDSLFHSHILREKRLLAHYAIFKKHKTGAFALDSEMKKIYAEKLWNIGKNLIIYPGSRYQALKIMIESQYYQLNLKRIFSIFRWILRKFIRLFLIKQNNAKN